MIEKRPELLAAFHSVLEHNTAGSPMRQQVIWTNLTPKEIRDCLMERDLYISEDTIRG